MPLFDVYDEKTPRRVKTDAERVTIGRTADNEVIISERRASRQHCEVRLDYASNADSSDPDTDQNKDMKAKPDSPAQTDTSPPQDTDQCYVLRDLQSRNGTVLNEQRIEGPTPLHNGDEISIGKSAIRFWVNAESIDPNAPDLPVIEIKQ